MSFWILLTKVMHIIQQNFDGEIFSSFWARQRLSKFLGKFKMNCMLKDNIFYVLLFSTLSFVSLWNFFGLGVARVRGCCGFCDLRYVNHRLCGVSINCVLCSTFHIHGLWNSYGFFFLLNFPDCLPFNVISWFVFSLFVSVFTGKIFDFWQLPYLLSYRATRFCWDVLKSTILKQHWMFTKWVIAYPNIFVFMLVRKW